MRRVSSDLLSSLVILILVCFGVSIGYGLEFDVFKKVSRNPFSEKQNQIVLRSKDFHSGSYEWEIVKASEKVSGDEISKTGYDSEKSYNAIVPGTVLNTLVYNNVYPEPYYGVNNAKELGLIPDITDVGADFYTYWFRTEFELNSSFEGKRVIMQFDGINYRADIWVNGYEVGVMAGMFKRGCFDITKYVNYKGANAIAVLVKPVDTPGGFRNKFKEVRAVGENRNGGDGQIGKNVTMLMSVGWDFTFSDGIRDRNTGIWRDIKIYPVSNVELKDSFVKSELSLPDLSSANQGISVDIVNHSSEPQAGVLRVLIPQANVEILKKVELGANETKSIAMNSDEYPELVFKNPKVWWPINKGEQNIYELTLVFELDGEISDIEKSRFAVRDVRSDRNTPDKSRQFYINGKPIFLVGTNWIPEAMLRNSEKRTYAELRYTAQAGINFIRFWAGGIAESDYFFDLCDELGIMVSMEYWQSGDTELPVDADLYRANVEDTIKRVRNHPSVIYHISANERKSDGIIPIQDIVDKCDGTRGYQVGSEVDGIHDGSPYRYLNPMFYYDDSASGRGSRINGMCPEYGAPCLPTLDCLEEMMEVKDIWPVNQKVWDYLDGGAFHEMVNRYVPAIKQYGSVRSAEDLAWKGQMVGATSYRSIWECWNYNKQDCGDRFTTGFWFWYLNSPIRQVCGRMWDWSLEPTAALYYSQDALEPIHAQFDFIKNTVSVNNELYMPFKGKVSIRIFNLDMSLVYAQSCDVEVGPDTMANDVIKVDLPSEISGVHFIRLDVFDTDGVKVSDTFYWRSTNKYKGKRSYTGPLYAGFESIGDLPEVELKAKLVKSGGRYNIAINNSTNSLAFMVQVKLVDALSNKPMRPTFYSDNFINLLPGESKSIEIEPYDINYSELKIVVDGWNIQQINIDV